MVLAGQYLERPALVDADGVTLEGLYHRGIRAPALLVCPAPGPGGGMDAAPIAELAWAAARAGHASLRFQYRGVGASTGSPDPARAVEDAEAAYRHLAATAGRRLAVAALGAGAEVALALARAHPELDRLVLVAPERLPPSIPSVRVLVLLPERGSAVAAQAAEEAVGGEGAVEIVPESDPVFHAGLPQLGKAAIAWITRGGR
jgi:alpha/beta superfamily hydrolase